jgi:glycogen operon protein
MYVSGELKGRTPDGEFHRDHSFLIMLNGGMADQQFHLPGPPYGQEYRLVLDSATSGLAEPPLLRAGDAVTVKGFCVVVARVETAE